MKHMFLSLALLPMTILHAQPLSGSFTIGGSSPSFATLQDAADAAVSQGVSGPVFFNIRPGTYTRNGGATTVLNIDPIPGVSSTNRVTFQADAASGGNADNVILQADFNSSSSSTTLTFVRTGFITLHNLTFKDADSLDTPAGFLVRSDFAPEGIVVDGCTFIGTPYIGTGQEIFGTDYGIAMQFSAQTVTVTNNRFYRMLRSVSMSDGIAANIIVEDNEFYQWYDRESGSGNHLGACILLNSCVHASVRRNLLDGTGGNGGSVGIFVVSSSTAVVERNLITNRVLLHGGGFGDIFTGISVRNLTSGSDSIMIVNNLVFARATSDQFGLDIQGPNNKILFNTINTSGGHSTTLSVIGPNCTVLNNIILGSSPTTYSGGNQFQPGRISNYNVIVPPNIIMDGTTFTDFSAYQFVTRLDSNSDSKNIFFTADSLGHITFDKCQSNDPALIGIPIPGITTDFYATQRDPVQPFRGAVEGTRTQYNTLFEGFRTGLTGPPFSLAAADFFDNDGDDDIAVPDWENRRVTLFRNLQPNRGFVNSGTVFTSVRPTVVKFFDFDGDGHLDLIVGGDTSAVEVFWGNGNGNFSAPTLGATYDRVRSIEPAPGFVTGRPTLLITEDGGLLPNESFMEYLVFDGRDFLCPEIIRNGLPFPEPDTIFANMDDLAYGDLGGDEAKEIVAVCRSGNFPLVLYKDLARFHISLPLCDTVLVTAIHTEYQLGTFNLSDASSIVMGDFDGDGDNDLVTTGFREDTLVFVRNQGNFLFSREFIPTTQAHGLVAFDYDNDGDLDLVTMNRILEQNGISIYLNDGTGHFTEKSNCFFPFATGVPTGIIAADFDHDGRTDVAITTIQDSLFVIYNLGLSSTGVKESPRQQVPAMFTLSQNYPNPFNPSTTINYEVTTRSHVTLKVYDLLGREVATVLNGDREAGHYSVTWNGTSSYGNAVASGVYFYKVEAQQANGQSPFTSVKKMVLIK